MAIGICEIEAADITKIPDCTELMRLRLRSVHIQPDLGSLHLFSLSKSSFTKMTASPYRFYTQRSINFGLTQRKFTTPLPTHPAVHI